MSPAAARLPRRDTAMVVILYAVMAAADLAAWLAGVPDRAWPAFILLPLSLALVWICYVLSLQRQSRRAAADPRSLGKVSAFMGRSLSLVGCVMTVAHVALLASFVRPGIVTSEQFVRAFMASLGVATVVMFNRAPKMLPAASEAPLGPSIRIAAWTGVGSGLAIVAAAVLAPMPTMPFLFFPFAMLPGAINYVARMRRPRGR